MPAKLTGGDYLILKAIYTGNYCYILIIGSMQNNTLFASSVSICSFSNKCYFVCPFFPLVDRIFACISLLKRDVHKGAEEGEEHAMYLPEEARCVRMK